MPSSDTQFKPGHPKTPGCGRKRKVASERATIVQDKITDMVLSRLDRFLHHMDYQYHGQNQEKANDMLLKLTKLVIPKSLPLDRYGDDDETPEVNNQTSAQAESPPSL